MCAPPGGGGGAPDASAPVSDPHTRAQQHGAAPRPRTTSHTHPVAKLVMWMPRDSAASSRPSVPMTLTRMTSSLWSSHQSTLGRPVRPAQLTMCVGLTRSISAATYGTAQVSRTRACVGGRAHAREGGYHGGQSAERGRRPAARCAACTTSITGWVPLARGTHSSRPECAPGASPQRQRRRPWRAASSRSSDRSNPSFPCGGCARAGGREACGRRVPSLGVEDHRIYLITHPNTRYRTAMASGTLSELEVDEHTVSSISRRLVRGRSCAYPQARATETSDWPRPRCPFELP